jgi:hypothetical protein
MHALEGVQKLKGHDALAREYFQIYMQWSYWTSSCQSS